MVWGDIYKTMAQKNITVVGGADPHVGVGGWVQGAGHGPLSSVFGLGADQVLEMEVITADGIYRVINADSDPDLFWAMRGGGPSTFAIMLSMTVKAYPKVAGYHYTFRYNTTADSDTFWLLAANFSSRLPTLSNQGAMGYYYLVQDSGLTNRSTSASILGIFLFPNKTKSEVDAIVNSLETSFKAPAWAKDQIYISSTTAGFQNFMEYWSTTNAPESVSFDTRYGSWLLDESALTSNVTGFASKLREITPFPQIWIGHLVAGPGVANAKPAGRSDAVLPAWRKAYVHFLQFRTWTPLNATGKALATSAIRNEVQTGLRSLAPNSGSYVNEADPSNPNWKKDYYGDHYEELLRVKKEWDPKGIFWCKPCIGYDEWDIIPVDDSSEDVNERGIGQDRVRLCRE